MAARRLGEDEAYLTPYVISYPRRARSSRQRRDYHASAAVFTGVVCNIRVIVPCSRKTPEGAGGPLSGVFLSSPDISEIRSQRSEVRGQKSEARSQRFSCGSGFQPRSCDLNDFYAFYGLNDINYLTNFLIL